MPGFYTGSYASIPLFLKKKVGALTPSLKESRLSYVIDIYFGTPIFGQSCFKNLLKTAHILLVCSAFLTDF